MTKRVRDDGRPRRIGRYELVRHLATGGMAEIYVARLPGIGGFARHVTLKTIRAERVEDQAFVHMFLDEARLVAALHHHNVAQVHDVGFDDGTYYLALEYVHGESSRAILERARDLNVTIPLEVSLAIVAGAAAGLHHAHESRAPDGTPIGIVHRDVSPSNILVGYDGSVKLIDFGIARAQVRHTQTQTGMIKGKFGYMSPEQCRGWPVDRRSDVFGLGIILYELTTQNRAFRAENDYETMQRIVHGDLVRPSRLHSGYPPDLELVVLRALAVDPDTRFATAAALLEAVERCVRKVGGLASPVTVGRFLTDLFGLRPEPWRLGADDDSNDDDDSLVAEVELVEGAFDPSSTAGALNLAALEDADRTSTLLTVPGGAATGSLSVRLPGLPERRGERAESPTDDTLSVSSSVSAITAGSNAAAAVYAAAEMGMPRGRLATGTQPMPMSADADGELTTPSPPSLPLPAPDPTGITWDLISRVHIDRGASTGSGRVVEGTVSRATTDMLGSPRRLYARALRLKWVWLSAGALLGLTVGIVMGLALTPDETVAATAARVPVLVAGPGGVSQDDPDDQGGDGGLQVAVEDVVVEEPPTARKSAGRALIQADGGTRTADGAPPMPRNNDLRAAQDRVLIRVTSVPRATVLYDGTRLGKTPFYGSVPRGQGMGTVRLRRTGCKTTKVPVARDRDIEVHVDLPPCR